MTTHSNTPGLFSELSCLLICAAVIWAVLLPGDKATDAALSFSSYIIPLILLVAGIVGLVACSLSSGQHGE